VLTGALDEPDVHGVDRPQPGPGRPRSRRFRDPLTAPVGARSGPARPEVTLAGRGFVLLVGVPELAEQDDRAALRLRSSRPEPALYSLDTPARPYTASGPRPGAPRPQPAAATKKTPRNPAVGGRQTAPTSRQSMPPAVGGGGAYVTSCEPRSPDTAPCRRVVGDGFVGPTQTRSAPHHGPAAHCRYERSDVDCLPMSSLKNPP